MIFFNNCCTLQKSKSFYQCIMEYLNDKIYIICLLLTAIGSYGFLITHYSVSTDDMAGKFYYEGQLYAQGRFTGSIIMKLLGLVDNAIWIQDFIGIVCLCFSTLLFCIIIDKFIKTKNHFPQIIFSCVFISYPLHSEIFTYDGCTIAIGLGCIFVALSILSVIKANENGGIRYYFISVFFLIAIVSWYESVLVIYVQIALFIFALYQTNNEKMSSKEYFKSGLKFIIPLVLGLVMEALVSNVLLKIMGLERNSYDKNVPVFKTTDFSQIKNILKNIFLIKIPGELIKGLFSFSVAVLDISIFIIFIIAAISLIKKKDCLLFLTYLILITTPFMIPILMGSFVSRTCQPFAMFSAISAFLSARYISEMKFKSFRRICYFGMSVFVLLQSIQINSIFVLDNTRYQQEKRLACEIGEYFEKNKLTDKNVILVGELELNENIIDKKYINDDDRRITFLKKIINEEKLYEYFDYSDSYPDGYCIMVLDTSCQSYFNWSIEVTAYNAQECANFFKFCGFNVKNGTVSQYNIALEYKNELNIWPQEGSVKEMEDYVIIRIGK